MTSTEGCARCGLVGSHQHRPHVLEIHGQLEDGSRAKLRFEGCLVCGAHRDTMIFNGELCPQLIVTLPSAVMV